MHYHRAGTAFQFPIEFLSDGLSPISVGVISVSVSYRTSSGVKVVLVAEDLEAQEDGAYLLSVADTSGWPLYTNLALAILTAYGAVEREVFVLDASGNFGANAPRTAVSFT